MPSSVNTLLFIVPPLIVVFAVLPGVYQNHLLLFNFVIFLMLAQGVNIIYGFTGYLPFGYVGFFGAGAYGFADHGDAFSDAGARSRCWSAALSASRSDCC